MTPERLQRKRHQASLKKRNALKQKAAREEYQKMLQKKRRDELVAAKRQKA